MWTKEKVAAVLQKNPDFEHLFEEGKGTYRCTYMIGGEPVSIFFTVDGTVEIWLLSVPSLYNNIQETQEFVTLAYKICNEKIK